MTDLRTPRLSTELVMSEVDECYLLFNPATNTALSLNRTASDVMFLCDGTRTVRVVAEALAVHHAKPVEEVEPEVVRTVEELRGQGVLID
jgi:hypothetical protein